MNSKSIGKRLRQLRLNTGLSQKDFAKKSGLSQSTVSAAESGRRGLKFLTITRFCQTAGVAAESLTADLQSNPYSVLDAEREARFKELLDRYLADQRDLWLFLFGVLPPRVQRGPSKTENDDEARARVAPTRKANGRVRRTQKS